MGTIADKLTYLGQTKTEIRDAIISKGVTVPAATTFREYAGKIREITAGSGGENPAVWTRPADWLSIENRVKEGDQKFVGLHAIYEDSNFISLSATGNYTVDWGDGVVENFASGVQAYHIYTYSSFPGTETTGGYRQAIVTVTSQSGQNLTNVNLQRKHKQAGLNSYSTRWLDIRISGQNMTSLVIGGATIMHRSLEACCFLGSNLITDFSKFFSGCSALQSVSLLDTSKGTNFSNMFTSCTALKTIPLLVTSKGTDFSYMFESCASLKTVPLLDTTNGMSFSGMFFGCALLPAVPLLNTAKGTDFSLMFSLSTALQAIPLLNTSNGAAFTSMFESCASLKTVPLLETSKGTDFSYMFQGCVSLQTVPLFKTLNGTDFSNMFFGCTALQTIPLLVTAKGSNFSNMFGSCAALETLPLLNTSAGTNFSGMFTNCGTLSKASFTGTKNVLSYAGCKLSRTALVDIFNNLASGVSSKTITITNNWGAPLLTAGEKAIATGKGWTIVG